MDQKEMEGLLIKMLDAVRPQLQADGGDAEFIRLEGNVATVKMVGSCGTCPFAMMTLKNTIETKFKELNPEIVVRRAIDTMNVSLVGVGGQGILLTAELLARAAAIEGLDVKKSEIHGMSQRGGSVVSSVRFGEKVYSPIIPEGQSDILVAFDRLEALRWGHVLKPGGRALLNKLDLEPITVTSGQQKPVENFEDRLKEAIPLAYYIDALDIAKKIGNERTMNMVIAGALSKFTPFSVDSWISALTERLPEKLVEVNLVAFAQGRNSL
ncbi:MAG: 2-oxoacid:acceptor oxidoreductase family protein [Kiritimatiellae bacterium]|nr:2-oxoacid:acceptor oxidoreductase family protein [Kiritimatiellia bacterium]